MGVAIKRVYESLSPRDGFRVLVDRVWPRGVAKAKARIDLWLREIAPSTALRRWFRHDPARWKTFCARYRGELREKADLLDLLRERARRGPVTLLYSARDKKFNQAAALKLFLEQRAKRRSAAR